MVGAVRIELTSFGLKGRSSCLYATLPKLSKIMVRAGGFEPPSFCLRGRYNEPLYDARMVLGLGADPN
jgi:hypothetical protein